MSKKKIVGKRDIEKELSILHESIALNVKEIRMKRDLTQEELADRAGLHRTRIVEIEGERYVPLLRTLVVLAMALDVGLEDLVKRHPQAIRIV